MSMDDMDEDDMMPKEGTDDYWKARADANTVTEAEAIKADPKRMRMALAILKKDSAARSAALKRLQAASKK